MTSIASVTPSKRAASSSRSRRSASFSSRFTSMECFAIGLGQRAQASHRAVRLLGRLHDDLGEGDAAVGGRLDLVEDEAVSHRIDEVQHVVETARERVNVLAIDGRDEGGVESPHHLMGDGVAGMLQIANLLHLGRSARIVEGNLLQDPRRGDDMPGLLLEEIEEAFVARQEPKHDSTSRDLPPMSTLSESRLTPNEPGG